MYTCNGSFTPLPVTPVTEKDRPLIQKAYAELWDIAKRRNIEGLKNLTRLSNTEMAYAEGK